MRASAGIFNQIDGFWKALRRPIGRTNRICAEYTILEKKVCAIFQANAIDSQVTAWYNRIKIEKGENGIHFHLLKNKEREDILLWECTVGLSFGRSCSLPPCG